MRIRQRIGDVVSVVSVVEVERIEQEDGWMRRLSGQVDRRENLE